MANLTSLTLSSTTPGDVSVLPGFFESAPRLSEVVISTISTSGAQVGRLVSPANLEMIYVLGGRTCSLLLDHLLTPVSASLTTRVDIHSPGPRGYFPRYPDNLKNLSDFTKTKIYFNKNLSEIQFTGPNGQVAVVYVAPEASLTYSALAHLAQFDASKIERLEIHYSNTPSRVLPYQTLLPATKLRTLVLYRCSDLCTFVDAACAPREVCKSP